MSYNNWKNYETWLVNLWLTNESHTERMLVEACNSTSPEQSLEYLVRDLLSLPDSGLLTDLVNSALSGVDWMEIVDHHTEAD